MGMKFNFFSKDIALLSISMDTSWSAEDNCRRLFLVLNSYFRSMSIRRDVRIKAF